jgi:hypothetical protein
MRQWGVLAKEALMRLLLSALVTALLVLAAPSSDARGDRPCPEGWVFPIDLIVGLDPEANGALRDVFETDLDWIAQDLRIHELFVSRWLSTRKNIALVQVGPEARHRRPVPPEVAERRLGELKAALEDLPYMYAVQYNHVVCLRF